MSPAPLSLRDVVAFHPGAELIALGEDVLGVGPRGLFALDGIDREGLRSVLSLIDGRRSVSDIAGQLEREIDRDDIVRLLCELEGSILRRVPEPGGASALERARVTLVGAGTLARAIRGELERVGVSRIDGVVASRFASCETSDFRDRLRASKVISAPHDALGTSCEDERAPPLTVEALARSFEGQSLVVCAAEGVHGRALIDINDAALSAGTPILFVAVEAGRCVVGPLVLPGKSPCFVCSRLSHLLLEEADRRGVELLSLVRFGPVPSDYPRWVAERVAFDVRTELERVVGRGPYPARMKDLLTVSPNGEQTAHFFAVTTCPSCRGHHRGLVSGADAPPPASLGYREGLPVRDQTGGSRTVLPAEAEARARGALLGLGVDVHCLPLPASAPEALHEIACPFYFAAPDARFSVDAPFLPIVWGTSFGKGTTDEQARCSALFEWIERNCSAWWGEKDLVRASWRDVRDHALDVRFLAAGFLPGLDLGKKPFDEGEPLDWVWAQCLRTRRPILVPATIVFMCTTAFLGSGLELPEQGTSGLSAGCSLGEAVLQGLLEVVERDAAGSALRNGVPFPRVCRDALRDPATQALFDRMKRAGYEPSIRDITSSVRIPTFEVYVVRPGEFTHHFAAGHGAHLDPEIALRRALTEAAQSLFFAVSTGTAEPIAASSSFFKSYPHRRQNLDATLESPTILAEPYERRGDVWGEVDAVVELVTKAIPEADVCFVDLSHPGLAGIHVVRAIISGTLHEVRPIQVHIPERCRHVPFERMFLGPR